MKMTRFLLSILMALASVLTGGGVVMADAVITELEHGGATITSGDGTNPDGTLTLKDGSEASPELFMADVDSRITKIRPMSTPIDQISRKAGRATKTDSMEVQYYAVGTRPIKGTVKTEVAASTTNDRFSVSLIDNSMLDMDDTLRFVGINGYKVDGITEDVGVDFVALVIDVDSNGHKILQPINGGAEFKGNPLIPANTEIVRMGKASAELNVMTAVFSNVPTKETQYCQTFIMQVEQSTLAKIGKKEVDWSFSDLEEDGIYDMRLGMEGSFMFGVKRKFTHAKTKDLVYTTGGIYYMAGKLLNIGTWDSDKEQTQIMDTQLIDLAKDLFTGTGVGNKRKIAIMGSEMMAAFSKIKSDTDKMVIRESVEVWDLKFKSFDTDFGEILAIHSEMMDMQGKSDEAFVLDPEFLTKRYHEGWSRQTYDLKSLGIRKTDAVVLSETSCLYLRYKQAHGIVKLKKAA